MFEFLITGNSISEAANAEGKAKRNQVCVSEMLWR